MRIAPLTGLFGTNSSGKTSILQVLLLLKQSAEFPDPGRLLDLGDERSVVSLGTFADVIHGHDTTLQLKLSLSWQETPEEASLDAAFAEVNDRIRLSRFVCIAGSDALRVREGSEGFIFTRNDGPDVAATSPWFFPASPPDDPTFSLQLLLEHVHYLGPLRRRPQRAPYNWSGSNPWDVGPDGGEFVQALLAVGGSVGTPSGLVSRGERTVQAVADSLKKMKLIDAFRIERVAPQRRDWEIRLKKTQSSAEVLLPDVGFGVSQVLPVLVLCYYAAEAQRSSLNSPNSICTQPRNLNWRMF